MLYGEILVETKWKKNSILTINRRNLNQLAGAAAVAKQVERAPDKYTSCP